MLTSYHSYLDMTIATLMACRLLTDGRTKRSEEASVHRKQNLGQIWFQLESWRSPLVKGHCYFISLFSIT